MLTLSGRFLILCRCVALFWVRTHLSTRHTDAKRRTWVLWWHRAEERLGTASIVPGWTDKWQ